MRTITAPSPITVKQQPSALQKSVKRVGIALIVLALALGCFTRMVAVFQYVTFDIGPDPDQIRDAFTVMKIWQGDFPVLGPPAYGLGLVNFHILPLYYYLFLPFTLLSKSPAFQAFPNALFSFLSIPLFIFLIHRLLEDVLPSKRLFISGLSGLWYSLSFGDIFISNFQWNPSAVPFFFMVLTLLYDLQNKPRLTLKAQALTWMGCGVTLAILVSLHASTLFVMPVVYAVISIHFMVKTFNRKGFNGQLALPAVGLIAAIVALTPYWVGEWSSHFSNTKAILKTVFSFSSREESSDLGLSLFTRLGYLVMNAINVVRQAYFWNGSVPFLVMAVVALALITYLAFSSFRGNRHIWRLWLVTWGIFLLASANLEPNATFFYYKLLLLPAPIVLVAVALAYGSLSSKKVIASYGAIAAFITLSCSINGYWDIQLMAAKYGPNRLMNTQEMAQIMQQLPEGAKICDPRVSRKRTDNNQYHYIDTYLTQKQIQVVEACDAGTFIIHPKRVLEIPGNFLNAANYQSTYFVKDESESALELWPIFKTVKNGALARPASLVFETQTAYLYRL